jgi:hypothetical protein
LHLFRHCVPEKITFTRWRSEHSNDGAHVQQENWAVVRTVVRYHRYVTAGELLLLNKIWLLQGLLTNFFYPQQKLLSKQRQGAKVIKKYDVATTRTVGPPAARRFRSRHGTPGGHRRRTQARGPVAAGPRPEQRAARHDHIQDSKEAESTGACTRRTDLSAGIGIWSEHVARELNVR